MSSDTIPSSGKGGKPKLLLISLRDPYMDSDRVMPPIGVMSLHSYMLACGVDSVIENDFDLAGIRKYESFTHFGISCMTPQKRQASQLLRAIKEVWPEKKVVIGGPHANFYLEDCLDEPFDHIVVGDGEFSLLKIMKGEAEERVLKIPVSEEEMNKLPLPWRAPELLNQYCFNLQGLRATTILTAKGCPMNCAFCEHAGSGLKIYKADCVGRQIDQAKEAGFNAIMFFDDIFCLSLRRVQELGGEAVKRGMPYRCFGHARTMTPEMAAALSATGCVEIGYGAESGSQKILDVIGKRTTVRQSMDFIEMCNAASIKVKAFIMLGLPGESRETVAETGKLLDFLMSRRFKSHFGHECSNDFDLTVYFPYKGTRIRTSIDRDPGSFDLRLEGNPDRMNGVYKGRSGSSDIAVRTSMLSSKEIRELHDGLYAKYKKLGVSPSPEKTN